MSSPGSLPGGSVGLGLGRKSTNGSLKEERVSSKPRPTTQGSEVGGTNVKTGLHMLLL